MLHQVALCAKCDLLLITSTSSDLGSGLRVRPGQSPGPGLCDMTSALLLSPLFGGLSHVTPLWEYQVGTIFLDVSVARLLKRLHRCTPFTPTISLLEVYLQDIVKDGSKVLVIWIALLIFS